MAVPSKQKNSAQRGAIDVVWLGMPEPHHFSAHSREQGLRTASHSSHPTSLSSLSVLISPEESP